MAPPSKLDITTRSLERLIKEEKLYHKELEQQESSILKFQPGDDENGEFILKQQVSSLLHVPITPYLIMGQRQAIEETRAVIPKIQERIQTAIQELESRLVRDISDDHQVFAQHLLAIL